MPDRRLILKSSTSVSVLWVAPIVLQVFLPVHAQTTVCDNSSIVGNWVLTFGDAILGLKLMSNGTGSQDGLNGRPVSWHIQGSIFIIVLKSGSIPGFVDNVFTGTIDSTCKKTSGTSDKGESYTGMKLP